MTEVQVQVPLQDYSCLSGLLPVSDDKEVSFPGRKPNDFALTDENEDRMTPLHLAAKTGNLEAINILFHLNSQMINARDNTGWTPIHYAARFSHVPALERLIQLGSNAIDTPDNYGKTPMHWAAQFGFLDVIEALVRLGSRALDAHTNSGCAPMHLAAYKGHVSAVELLVNLGSRSVDRTNTYGRTPLHCAVISSNGDELISSTVKVLRSLGAEPNNVQKAELTLEQLGLASTPADEDEVAEVRYRAHFSRSLTSRLLLELDNGQAQRRITPQRLTEE